MTTITASARDQQRPPAIHAELVLPVEPTSTAVIEAGARALNELPHIEKTQIWSRWMVIAAAVTAMRNEAMLQAGTNQPTGFRYRRAHGDLIGRYGFDRLSKSMRSHLIDCLTHRAPIEEWLAGLPMDRRLKLTHPVAILRNWRAAALGPDAAKRRSTISELKKRIAELEAQIARLRDDDGGSLTGKDSARDAVLLLRALYSESKLAEIRRLLGKDGAK